MCCRESNCAPHNRGGRFHGIRRHSALAGLGAPSSKGLAVGACAGFARFSVGQSGPRHSEGSGCRCPLAELKQAAGAKSERVPRRPGRLAVDPRRWLSRASWLLQKMQGLKLLPQKRLPEQPRQRELRGPALELAQIPRARLLWSRLHRLRRRRRLTPRQRSGGPRGNRSDPRHSPTPRSGQVWSPTGGT
jgi:hypothetical protein